MSKKKDRISIEQILFNEPREIEVEGYGTILVRDPTKGDRIEAKKEAQEHPLWDQLPNEEKELLVLDRLILRIIVDPVIPKNVYFDGRESAIRDVIDSVILDYTKRLRELADKRKKTITDFLELMKARNLEITSTS